MVVNAEPPSTIGRLARGAAGVDDAAVVGQVGDRVGIGAVVDVAQRDADDVGAQRVHAPPRRRPRRRGGSTGRRTRDLVPRIRGGGGDVAEAERRDGVGAALLVGRDEEDAHRLRAYSSIRRSRRAHPQELVARERARAAATDGVVPALVLALDDVGSASQSPPPDMRRTKAVRASRSAGRVGQRCGAPSRSRSRDPCCGRRRSRGSAGSAGRRRGMPRS